MQTRPFTGMVAPVMADVHHWYHPALRMDGSVVELDESEEGQRCGVWVEQDGTPVIEVSGFEAKVGKGE